MINVSTLVREMDLEVIAGSEGLERNVEGIYIGDLLSWVMANINKDNCWITIQTHVNIVAVALLGEASCIIIPEKAEIDQETINKSNLESIPLLRSKSTAYELAVKFSRISGAIRK